MAATTSGPTLGPQPDRAARRAVAFLFAANGATVATWVVRIPDVRAALGLRDAALGVALAALSAGVVLALPVAGGIVARTGSRRVAVAGAVAAGMLLWSLAFARGPLVLGLLLLVFGAGISTMDVGMNTHGVGVEAAYGRSILVGFHAAWSLGSLTAAGAGALALASRVPLDLHFGVVAVLVVATTVAVSPWLRIRDRTTAASGVRRRVLALPHGAIVPIAIVALGAALAESTATDWSGIFLRDAAGVPPGHVGWGFVAFSAAMTVTRLLGDRVADRMGRAATMMRGAWVAATGFVLVAAVPTLPVVLVGCVAIGMGIAVTIPLSFAAAGRTASTPGEGIAGVAAVSYAGFLVAPPAIGAVADATSIRVSFAAVAVVLCVLTGRPGALRDQRDGD